MTGEQEPFLAAAVGRRWKFHRHAWIERWRVGVELRVYHGLGLPQFELEFRLGRPKRVRQPEHIDLEGEFDV